MKNLITLFLLFLTYFSVQAQNSRAERIEFNYLQFPTIQLNTAWKYMPKVIQENQSDILKQEEAYLAKLEKLTKDYEEAVKVYENYSAAEKLIAGKPKPPKLSEEPPYTGEVLNEEEVANKYIKVDGFERSLDDAEFVVEIILSGFTEEGKFEKDKEGQAFHYAVMYKCPVSVRVYDKEGKEYLNKVIDNADLSKITATHSSSIALKNYWKKNGTSFMKKLQKEAYDNALKKTAKYINDTFGYQQKSRTVKFYTGKAKKLTYPKLDQAIEITRRALIEFGDGSSQDMLTQLNEAIVIWKSVLQEKNLNDKKARVNQKVSSGIYWNCILTYAILNDFDKGKDYLTELKLNGRGVSEKDAQSFWEEFEARKRFVN